MSEPNDPSDGPHTKLLQEARVLAGRSLDRLRETYRRYPDDFNRVIEQPRELNPIRCHARERHPATQGPHNSTDQVEQG